MSFARTMQPAPRIAFGLAALLWAGLIALLIAAVFSTRLGLRGDGLALAIGALTLFVASIAMTFSLRYMRANPRQAGFSITVALLVAAILGFVFTRNLLVFAVAWCASGWLLARLIGHTSGWSEARAAARRSLTCFAIGDAALLGAFALLGWHAGSLELDAVLAHVGAIPTATVTAAALLLVVAAVARCALPPFAGWLLTSMTAPTPVSALMHAGFVNAGGFLLIRFAPVVEAAPAVRIIGTGLGLLGAIYGIGIMVVRPDIKRLLAGSTVSQMGFMIMCCGLGAYSAALWHIIAHGLFKAWLFLGAGSAIGTVPASRRHGARDWRISLVVAAVALSIALVLALVGISSVALIPGLLALATAAVTLTGSIGGGLSARASFPLTGFLVALGAVNLLGLGIAAAAVGRDGPVLLDPWGNLAVLAILLGAWTWQGFRQARGTILPPAFYIYLLNAAALRTAGTGQPK